MISIPDLSGYQLPSILLPDRMPEPDRPRRSEECDTWFPDGYGPSPIIVRDQIEKLLSAVLGNPFLNDQSPQKVDTDQS